MYAHFICLLAAILSGTLVGANSTTQAGRRSTHSVLDWFTGDDLVSGWSYYTGADPTNGNVNYLSQQDAANARIAWVTSSGAATFAVDSWSSVPAGGNRNSVRVSSPKSYNNGLFILDAATMPVGCGVWPAFWTNGPNWPLGGEIDIVEGVNNQQNNQMTLHTGTSNPCNTNVNDQSAFTGQVLNSNCYCTASSNDGCSISDPDPTSYGYGFNDAQGGVFAMEWQSGSISIWHFSRNNIPSDIIDAVPDPGGWGTPAAYWDTTTCDIVDNFYDHSIIIDTTICGDWAGAAYSSSGCSGTCSDIVADAGNFGSAFWTINYVAVYQ